MMETHVTPKEAPISSEDRERLEETKIAFNQVAEVYDGPVGNNQLIQRLRLPLYKAVNRHVAPGSHLLDIGCGTGLDVVAFAKQGYRVTAIDWAEQMIRKTRQRVEREALSDRVETHVWGAHQLNQLQEHHFDGLYSNLGALNCPLNLRQVAQDCADLLADKGVMVCSIIGRICPWEIAYFLAKGRLKRAFYRFKRTPVAVGLQGGQVWTQYYTPREFYNAFEEYFEVLDIRTLNLFTPPPYLIDWFKKYPSAFHALESMDKRFGDLPVLRGMGDHFLITMQKRS